MQAHRRDSGTYSVFALACFAACIWSITAVPETAGVSLEEIDKIFNSSAGMDEEERRASVAYFPPAWHFVLADPPFPLRLRKA